MKHPSHHIERFFYWLGKHVGKHPIPVIVSILLFSAVSSLGLFKFREVNNVRSEYSPMNAPSQLEYQVAKKFLKQEGSLDPCYVMARGRDEGNLLRDEYRWTLYNLTRALQSEVRVEKNGQWFGFTDLCEPYCELNTAFLAFLKLYDPTNPSTYTYPSIELFGTQAFIGNNVYGIKLKPESNELLTFNTAVIPIYLVASHENTDVMIEWQHAAIELFERPEYSRLLKTGMTGDNLVSFEVRRMGIETAPLIIGSIISMIIFVVTFSFRVNAVQSKPWESFIGCLIPLLAIVTALGLMSAVNMKFQSIVVAALFLVLSVGIDDIFILTRAWDRTDPRISIPERTALTLEDAGPSITISALTNIMSFAIGASSDTPAIRTFCIFSAISITVCFIYQLVLLSAIIALSGRREEKGYQAILCCLRANPQARSPVAERCGQIHDYIVHWWARTVTRWPMRVFLAIGMCGYFYVSWIGIRRIQSNISIDKMALPDSYLHDFQESFESALRNMQPISIFVLKPGDLRDPDQLARVKRLVYDYEHSINAYGPNSTFFWLTQYEDFFRFYGESEEFAYTEIPAFFKSATYFYLSSFVHMNESACLANEPECISSFFFITNFHDVIKYHELVPTVQDWRRIAADYADLEVYAYSDHTPFVDQTMAIDSTVFGSVIATLLCTIAICVFFIPHYLSIIAAAFAVGSTSFGIFGLLSLWGCDLDPLSLAALLMAIGFSVDFVAHISYHYYKTPPGHPRKRIEHALGVIGWPMIEVGLSTIVALSPLLFKQSYLALVFLKTLIIIVLLGMFHGLIVLPCVLTMITPYKPKSTNSSAESSERSSQRSTERKESFYKTQHLIKAMSKDKLEQGAGWLTKKCSFKRDRVTPLSVAELENTIPTAKGLGFVHKIPLGRSNSNAL
ncbi:Patched-related protein 9 [Aphelenchoides besseyi]|nr:Patched-related protein 9 [Aphelenchoides besseyi]